MRINGIFQNLLSNAAKFTPAGGRVELLVEQESITDSKIIYKVIVRDNGIGMSQDFLKRIYEPFTQERTKETARIGGSGLGLSIVKKLLEILGGDIRVKSKLGKGSEFTLTIPFPLGKKELAKGSVQPLLEMQTQRFAGKEILLCDDNEMNREIATAILQSEGIHVTSAADGEECVQTFCASETDEFDLILMDIRMPVMNGYEATQAIRRLTRPDAKKIPIVAMSADAYPEDIKKSLNAGMNAHIAKPIDTEKMLLTIYQLICC
jgi:CheY-like chemotaxis protein